MNVYIKVDGDGGDSLVPDGEEEGQSGELWF